VGAEFGAIGDGFGPSDAEVENMSMHYLKEDHAVYFVAKLEGEIVGGGGVALFSQEDEMKAVCELRKLFLLPKARGFAHLDAPLQSSIHGGCDVWMLKEL